MWPFKCTPNLNDEAFKAEFRQAQTMMRPFQIVGNSEGFNVVISVCLILNDGDRRLGIKVARGYRSSAIHEINHNGTFSKKGPYWTKRTWIGRPYRFAVCKLAVSTAPAGLKNPNEQIRSYGLSVIEMDTDQLPPMEFEDWKLIVHRK